MSLHRELLTKAVQLAQSNAAAGSRPFAAIVAMEGEIVGTGVNDVVHSHDLTAHAEMAALRSASRRLGRTDLAGSIVYASGHPCPMCLAALVMANVDAVYYAFSNAAGEAYGFSSAGSYQRLRLSLSPPPLPLIELDTGIPAQAVYGERE